MELFTMIKANIRHKKGSFVSIILLMAVISMALTAIISVWDNIYGGVIQAQERAKTANIVCMVNKNQLSEKMISKVKQHTLVKNVKTETAIAAKVSYHGKGYSNEVYMQKLPAQYQVFDSDGRRYQEETPLNHGEIYISQGMKTNFSCKTGDSLAVETEAGFYEFKIKGTIEEPQMGASVIGWKKIFICKEDYENIYGKIERLGKQTEFSGLINMVSIYKKDGCGLTDGKFARQVNLDTGIADMGFGAMTREMSVTYTTLFPKIICMILFVFVVLLLASVVVVLCHSVSTGIEMEYVTFGVMKSQGFSTKKIQAVFVIQYLAAEILGAAAGIVAAVPLCEELGNLFHPITGIIPQKAVSYGTCGGILLAVFVISILSILVITRKITRISPVRAIAGVKKEIYFDSRLKAPVSKKMLSSSLAFRQFTSNKRQYARVIAVVAILVYFMITMMVLTNVITATSAWETMGISYSDLSIELSKEVSDAKIEQVEESIRQKSNFQTSYKSCGNYYMSINGEQMMACIYSEPEFIKAVSKGRAPVYDNEIVMTEIAADNLGLKIGDKVSVGYQDKKETFLISGLNQFMNDAGVNFSMTKSAASKLGNTKLSYLGYILEDKSRGNEIETDLNRRYGTILTASFDETPMDDTYELAIYVMTCIVYAFSIIFAVTAVQMVCSKAFLKERRDIGIYKALGFTSGRLRLQFAVRYSIAAVFGAAVGSGVAAAFTGKMLSFILRLVGISSFQVTFNFAAFAVPVGIIITCFYLFAFLASRRIKRVEVKELIVE